MSSYSSRLREINNHWSWCHHSYHRSRWSNHYYVNRFQIYVSCLVFIVFFCLFTFAIRLLIFQRVSFCRTFLFLFLLLIYYFPTLFVFPFVGRSIFLFHLFYFFIFYFPFFFTLTFLFIIDTSTPMKSDRWWSSTSPRRNTSIGGVRRGFFINFGRL